MYHKIIIVGNLGRDPEMRFSPDGKPVTNLSVAVNDDFGETKRTIWVRVSVWGKQAESCNNYLKKGSKVLVEGRLTYDPETGGPRVYETKGGHGASFEMIAQTVRFLNSRESGDTEFSGEADMPF